MIAGWFSYAGNTRPFAMNTFGRGSTPLMVIVRSWPPRRAAGSAVADEATVSDADVTSAAPAATRRSRLANMWCSPFGTDDRTQLVGTLPQAPVEQTRNREILVGRTSLS